MPNDGCTRNAKKSRRNVNPWGNLETVSSCQHSKVSRAVDQTTSWGSNSKKRGSWTGREGMRSVSA